MNELAARLRRACELSGLRFEPDFVFKTATGDVVAVALLPDLGGPKGMLVIPDFGQVRERLDVVSEAGFGYAVLDQPRASENFELEEFREMFRDWGWNGSPESSPDWMAV